MALHMLFRLKKTHSNTWALQFTRKEEARQQYKSTLAEPEIVERVDGSIVTQETPKEVESVYLQDHDISSVIALS